LIKFLFHLPTGMVNLWGRDSAVVVQPGRISKLTPLEPGSAALEAHQVFPLLVVVVRS